MFSIANHYIGPHRWRIIKEHLFGKMLCKFGRHNMACTMRFGEIREVFSNRLIHAYHEPFTNRCLRPGCNYEEEA